MVMFPEAEHLETEIYCEKYFVMLIQWLALQEDNKWHFVIPLPILASAKHYKASSKYSVTII